MSEIDTYLQTVTPEQKEALEHIRTLIHEVIPDAEETMGYGMPTFKFKGKNVVHFAAFKDHMSLFPSSEPIETLKDQLADFKTSKGTIQFTLAKPIPDNLVKDLVTVSLENTKARLKKQLAQAFVLPLPLLEWASERIKWLRSSWFYKRASG